MSGKYITNLRQDMRLYKTTPQRLVFVLGLIFVVALPFVFELDFTPPLDFPWNAWSKAINLALIWGIGAAAFNLLAGYTGQISVAHAAFLILGSITGAYFGQASEGLGWSFWIVLPLSAVIGATVGVIVGIPALRVRGLYLFMATLAFHFAAILAWRKFQHWQVGFNGIRYAPPEIPTWLFWLPFIDPDENGQFLIQGDFRWYWVILPVVAICVMFMVNILRTSEGRAFVAVRDNDVAASLLGIDVARTKIRAFAVSSMMVTVSGTMLSFFITARSDESWSMAIILNVAVMTVVGGFSTIAGGIAGALFFFLIPVWLFWFRGLPGIESIPFIDVYGEQVDLLFFGLAIVLVLIFKPDGLVGLWEDVKRYFRIWPYRH